MFKMETLLNTYYKLQVDMEFPRVGRWVFKYCAVSRMLS